MKNVRNSSRLTIYNYIYLNSVQSVINGEDRNVSNVYNTDAMLITCDNTTDIFISKSTKDTIWNLEYTVLSLPIRHNFCKREHHLQLP
jgi:hypothetical protein